MKVLLTGADGQLGADLCRVIAKSDLIPLTQNDIEITDADAVGLICRKFKPDIIINTAAYVRVDDCEDECDLAFKVNALGARNMAVAAHQVGAALIHLSTDYVFGGEGPGRTVPYTEFDPPCPVSTYGRSKLAGEDYVRHLCPRHIIVRTSGLFGVAGAMGKGGNFIEAILSRARKGEELKVVDDQWFSPTYSYDLAGKMAELMSGRYYGTLHITSSGVCTWYQFACRILELAGLSAKVTPVTTEQYPLKAKRPAYSVLDNYQLRLLGLDNMPSWQSALKHYLNEKGYLPGAQR
jgi:dTDP-4-dehydrorhamnose reductase